MRMTRMQMWMITREHIWALLLIAAAISIGCRANETVLQSGKETPVASNGGTPKSDFESDLDAMRSAGFTFIYVLRRRDGAPMDAEDRGVIRTNTVDMNRRVSADDGRAFIIGSNYQLPSANHTALTARFAIQDLSPPPTSTPATNTNANK